MDMTCCMLCPRRCEADRTGGRAGFCRMPAALRVAKAMLHYWEEPVLAGPGGSGAVFFSGCTLRCIYCQNREISHNGIGEEWSVPQLRQTFLDLIASGAENIDLVTPTHFLPWIVPALRPRLPVPVVYNCGGYERVETLRELEGLVDVYLPDLKYADAELSRRLSGAEDYFPVAAEAIREMVRQTGPCVLENGRLKRGVLIRHLILPGQIENSLRVLDWIGQTFQPGTVLVSLMRQYTPVGPACAMPPLDRTVTKEEYRAVLSWMFLNRLEGFTQDADAAGTQYIPDFAGKSPEIQL